MKITKTRLKQIIKEELDNFELDVKDDQLKDKRGGPTVGYPRMFEIYLKREKRHPAIDPHRSPGGIHSFGRGSRADPIGPGYEKLMGQYLGDAATSPQKGYTIKTNRELKNAIDELVDYYSVDGIGPDPDKIEKEARLKIKDIMSWKGKPAVNVGLTGTSVEYPSDINYRTKAKRFTEGRNNRDLSPKLGRLKINEELTRQDKNDVKKMVEKELEKLLKKKDTKDQVGEIVKKIMKKLYKDLSLEHPYIIDRIKV